MLCQRVTAGQFSDRLPVIFFSVSLCLWGPFSGDFRTVTAVAAQGLGVPLLRKFTVHTAYPPPSLLVSF